MLFAVTDDGQLFDGCHFQVFAGRKQIFDLIIYEVILFFYHTIISWFYVVGTSKVAKYCKHSKTQYA